MKVKELIKALETMPKGGKLALQLVHGPREANLRLERQGKLVVIHLGVPKPR